MQQFIVSSFAWTAALSLDVKDDGHRFMRIIVKRKIRYIQTVILVCLLTACRSDAQDLTADKRKTEQVSQSAVEKQENSETADTSVRNIIQAEGNTLESRFAVPEGYTRLAAQQDSFAEFLRSYPLFPDKEPVHLYDGREKGNQNDHVAVFDMEMADGDLQQCADSVLRLYAEYFYRTKQYSRMKFHLTNGFELSFDEWRKGKRVRVDGNDTVWVNSASASDSEETFFGYLEFLFNYAGTLSMGGECEPQNLKDVQPGDVFLYSGSPGHVVLILDVCEDSSGNRAFLLGQGYMPAQQFHVLKNPADEDNPWYYVAEMNYPFITPEYTFDEGSFMRPVY